MSKKDIPEWDESYLLNLPSGEFDWIEFKESKKLDFSLPGINRDVVLRELSKQVSAFANSGGGVIVFGIENPKSGQSLNVDNGGGVSLSLQNGTREWLEDVIPNLVDFPISKVNVYELTANGNSSSQIAQDKGLIIVDIPSSEQAPHQASDNLYYARVGGKSRPINHRFVMDIIGRAKHPKMVMSVAILTEKEKRNTLYESGSDVVIKCFCKNVSSVYANYVNGWVYIPKSLVGRGYGRETVIDDKNYQSFYFENIHKDRVGEQKTTRRTFLGGQEHYYPDSEPLYITRFDPILPGLGFTAKTQGLNRIKEDLLNEFIEEEIRWTIYADNSPIQEGSVMLKDLISKLETE